MVRVSPKDLTDEIRSNGPHDLRVARDLATKSLTLYRKPDQVSTVNAALKEVIDGEINHRVEQARMADRQNDWPKASGILRETLRDIPESSAEINKLDQEYYQQGAEAEAKGNWQDAIKAFRKTLDIIPADLQQVPERELDAYRFLLALAVRRDSLRCGPDFHLLGAASPEECFAKQFRAEALVRIPITVAARVSTVFS